MIIFIASSIINNYYNTTILYTEERKKMKLDIMMLDEIVGIKEKVGNTVDFPSSKS